MTKKNPNLHLRKTQLLFYVRKKFRSTSNEDADLFYCEEKFRSTSKEDVDLCCCEEKFKSASKEDAICFILKKNSDLHLRKIISMNIFS